MLKSQLGIVKAHLIIQQFIKNKIMKHTSLYLFKIKIIKGLGNCEHVDGFLVASTKDFARFEKNHEAYYASIELIVDPVNNIIKTVYSDDPDITSSSPAIFWEENYSEGCYGFYLWGVLPTILKVVNGWMFMFYNEEYSDIETFVKDFRNKRKVSIQKSIMHAKVRLNTNIAFGDTTYYLPLIGIQ